MENELQLKEFISKRGWLIGAVLLLFAISFGILLSETQRTNLASVAGNISRQLELQEKDFYRFLENETLLRRLATASYTTEDLELLTRKPYSILLYKSGELVFWNSNQIIPSKPYWYEDYKPGVNYDKFNNAVYQLILRQYSMGQASLSGLTAIALLPLEYKYEVENQYLNNSINPILKAPQDIAFSLSKTDNAVRVGNAGSNSYIYLEHHTLAEKKEVNWIAVILQVIALAFLLFILRQITETLLQTRGLPDAALFLGITIFLLRVLCMMTGVPSTLENYKLFNTNLPNSALLFSSLGDVLLNVALITWFISFVYRQVNFAENKNINIGKTKQLLYILCGLALVAAATIPVTRVLYLLVVNFNFSLDLSSLPDFNIETLAALLLIILLFISLFYVLQFFGMFFLQIGITLQQRVVSTALLALACFAMFVFGALSQMHFILLAGIAVWILWLPLLQLPFQQFFLTLKGMAWIVGLSAMAAFLVQYQTHVYEKTVREKFAEKKAIQEDKLLESKFSNIATKIMLEDEIIRKYYSNKPILPSDELIKRVKKVYLQEFEGKYNIKSILPFNEEGYCFDEKNRLVYLKEYSGRIGANSINTTNNYLYLIPNEMSGYNYLSKLPVFQPEDSIPAPIGYLIIELEPKTGRAESVYPELIIEDKFRESKGTEDYSYAIYQGNALEISRGNFSYPLEQPSMFISAPNVTTAYIHNNGYSHLIYQRSNADSDSDSTPAVVKQVVVSKPDAYFMPFMSLFAMFLLMSVSFLLIALIIRAIFNINKGRNVLEQIIFATLQRRISFSMLLLVFVTFILVGAVTIDSFYKRSTNNHRAQLIQKEKEALATIENMIDLTMRQQAMQQQLDNSSPGAIAEAAKITKIDILQNASDMTTMLSTVSKIYDIDMNLYNKNGELIASSLPDIFNRGLLSKSINPLAWFQLSNKKNNQFIQNEQIGTLNYLSAYIPVKNELNNTVEAYLNLPYFARQKVFNRELSAFIGSLLNVYLLLFILATLIAISTARALTTPLRMISNKLKDIKLGQKNELLYWPQKDEMGTLVEQYNKTIIELDRNVKKLAETERQSAWKEMARQVAHEIKNPLTPMKLSIQHLLRASRENHPKVKEMTERIARSIIEQIDTLSHIATEFSTFAKMPKPNNEFVNVKDVLNNVVALYDDSIQIHYNFPDEEDISVYADRSQLLRVFTNIIKNAIQAIPEDRKGEVWVNMVKSDENVIIGIKDNGTGIPEELSEKVFTPNFTTRSSGMGLGLAMTQNIIHAANGKIWFTSKQNEGTTFFVQLPLSEVNGRVVPPPVTWN